MKLYCEQVSMSPNSRASWWPGHSKVQQVFQGCGRDVQPCNPVPVSFQHANEDVERMLLGNKCDMEDKRVVPKAKGEQVSVKQKLLYPSQQIIAKTSPGGWDSPVGCARE